MASTAVSRPTTLTRAVLCRLREAKKPAAARIRSTTPSFSRIRPLFFCASIASGNVVEHRIVAGQRDEFAPATEIGCADFSGFGVGLQNADFGAVDIALR